MSPLAPKCHQASTHKKHLSILIILAPTHLTTTWPKMYPNKYKLPKDKDFDILWLRRRKRTLNKTRHVVNHPNNTMTQDDGKNGLLNVTEVKHRSNKFPQWIVKRIRQKYLKGNARKHRPLSEEKVANQMKQRVSSEMTQETDEPVCALMITYHEMGSSLVMEALNRYVCLVRRGRYWGGKQFN